MLPADIFGTSTFFFLPWSMHSLIFAQNKWDHLVAWTMQSSQHGFVVKLKELILISPIKMSTSFVNMKYTHHLCLTISQSRIARPLPLQRVSTMRARVTLKTSEVVLFNYCVLMIKWEQHNGLINFLITVSTKSNYNQIHRLVNHTSIKLKQSPLGSNHFQTEQMSRLAQTPASGQRNVYLRTVTLSKGYLGWLEISEYVRNFNRNCVCTIIMSVWARLCRTWVVLCAQSNHYSSWQSRQLAATT